MFLFRLDFIFFRALHKDGLVTFAHSDICPNDISVVRGDNQPIWSLPCLSWAPIDGLWQAGLASGWMTWGGKTIS